MLSEIIGTRRFSGLPTEFGILDITQTVLGIGGLALLRTFFWMLLILELDVCRCDCRGQSMISSRFICLLQKGIIVFSISVLIESFLVLFSISEILFLSSSSYSPLSFYSSFIPASCFLSLLVCSDSQVTSSSLIVPCHLSCSMAFLRQCVIPFDPSMSDYLTFDSFLTMLAPAF